MRNWSEECSRQRGSDGRLLPSTPRKYPSAFAAYSIIARQEGVKGLWTGVGPNISRNAIINAAELASYDQARYGQCSGVRFAC